jgi:anaerobic selenocysteine-containing dehydrogenase
MRVLVRNDRGGFLATARVAAEIRKGVAWAPSLWWGRYAFDGRTVNETTSQRETDMGRGPVFYDNLVEVEAVATLPADATGIATSTSASTPIAARR